MAALTALELLNKVLKNNGLKEVSALTALTGIQVVAWDALNEVIKEMALAEHWKPLEMIGTMTMTTGTSTYAPPTDMVDFDRHSFRYNEASKVTFLTPEDFDREYITQTDTGTPYHITYLAGSFKPYRIPDAAASAKLIKFRYWKRGTILTTATATGTSWFPEGYDEAVLVNLATYKVMHYRGHPEQTIYYEKVYGNKGTRRPGTLNEMRRSYGSPQLFHIPFTAIL